MTFNSAGENRIAGVEEKASKSEAESDVLYQLSQKMAEAVHWTSGKPRILRTLGWIISRLFVRAGFLPGFTWGISHAMVVI